LLDACGPLIAGAIRRAGSVSAVLDADDQRQVANLAVAEAAARWDPTRASFKTYAARVIRARLINARRNVTRRGTALSLDLADDDGSTTPSPASAREVDPQIVASQRDEAAKILKQLAPRERRLVRLLARGKTYESIALTLGLAADGVDSAVQRLRRRARGLRAADGE
jgi:RNA polymerase sigma factor (sigma-70 family)